MSQFDPKPDYSGFLYCKCWVPPNKNIIGATPMQMIIKLNNHFVDKNLQTRCLFTSFASENLIELNTVQDVRKLVDQIKNTKKESYFNIPHEFRNPLYQIKSSGDSIRDPNSSEISEEFLKDFVINKNDSIDQKEQELNFQEFDRFLQDLLRAYKDTNYYNYIDQDKTSPQTLQQNFFMCFGPIEELKMLHNQKVNFNTRDKTFFYFKTSSETGELKPEMDEKKNKDAQEKYEKQYFSQLLSRIQFGVLKNEEKEEEEYQFFEIFDFSTSKSDQECTHTLQDIAIYFDTYSQQDKKQTKTSQVEFVLKYPNFQLLVEIPYLYVGKVLESKGVIYLVLVVPPKFYIRKQQGASSMENINQQNQNWKRIENFIALDLGKQGNELLRIEFVNNTVIQLNFGSTSKTIINNFKKKFENKTIKRIDSFQSNEEYLRLSPLYQQLQELNFNLSYSILTLLSHNKMSVFKMKDVIQQIKVYQKNKISDFVLEKAIEKLYHERYQMSDSDRYQILTRLDFQKNSVLSVEGILLNQEKRMEKNINLISSRRVTVTPSGLIYNLKEPEQANRVMRIFRANIDQFLRMVFSDDSLESPKFMPYVSRYFRVALEKIEILNKTYKNFGWSASQLRSSAAWFFSDSEDLTKASVINRIGYFADITPAAKKSARIGQCFSSSLPFNFKTKPNFKFIPDIKTPESETKYDEQTGQYTTIYRKQKVFTDGIGMMTKDLLVQIKNKLEASFMCAIQVRYGGAKGVFTLYENPDNPEEQNTIYLRPSMIKYSITDSSDEMQIDILDRNKYREGYLNRQVIILLKSLKIDDQHFINAQNEYINELSAQCLKDANIFSHFNNDYSKDGTQLYPITRLLRLMNSAKIDMENDPFCKGVIYTLKKRGFYILRKKSNIYLKKSARLMGVIDEYKLLKENEVFAYISADNNNTFMNIDADAIVVKNPCLHPGDIRKVRAVSLEEIQKRYKGQGNNPFHRLRNVLIFPQVGKEPITSQIAGSDLDGDCYFISWDERFVPTFQVDPFGYDQDSADKDLLVPPKKSKDTDFKTNARQEKEEMDPQMLDFFIEFMNNENLGKIDNTHLARADQSADFALDEKCLQLATLHAEAVDYAKTGKSPKVPQNLSVKKYPDFMEKLSEQTYESKSILGILYRNVKNQYEQFCSNKNQSQSIPIKIEVDNLFNPIYYKQGDDQNKVNELKKFLKEELESAIEANIKWNQEIANIMNFFGAKDEFEIYTGNFSKLMKIERKKKMSAEVVQQRIINKLLDMKSKFELEFFSSLPSDKELFQVKQSKSKHFSKKCKLRATIWFIVSYLNNNITLDQLLIVGQPFEQNTFCAYLIQEINQIRKLELAKAFKEEQPEQRGNRKTPSRIFQQNIGLCWFIIGEIILEIKKENLVQKSENLKNKMIENIDQRSKHNYLDIEESEEDEEPDDEI